MHSTRFAPKSTQKTHARNSNSMNDEEREEKKILRTPNMQMTSPHKIQMHSNWEQQQKHSEKTLFTFRCVHLVAVVVVVSPQFRFVFVWLWLIFVYFLFFFVFDFVWFTRRMHTQYTIYSQQARRFDEHISVSLLCIRAHNRLFYLLMCVVVYICWKWKHTHAHTIVSSRTVDTHTRRMHKRIQTGDDDDNDGDDGMERKKKKKRRISMNVKWKHHLRTNTENTNRFVRSEKDQKKNYWKIKNWKKFTDRTIATAIDSMHPGIPYDSKQ